MLKFREVLSRPASFDNDYLSQPLTRLVTDSEIELITRSFLFKVVARNQSDRKKTVLSKMTCKIIPTSPKLSTYKKAVVTVMKRNRIFREAAYSDTDQ